MAVVIETTLGDLTVDLFIQERPKACLNFLKLCKLKYYNYNLFHTVERGFIAQTGDPSGVGDGGESVWGVVEGSYKRFFEAESLPKIKHSEPGLVSLVSVGKNMVGSQFFFTLGADLTSLDGIHCVIGEVAEGHEVLRKLNESIVDDKFRPYQDIRVTHTVILEDPFEDPRGFQIPSRSPSPSAERMINGRIGADEDIDDTDGKTAAEIQEMLADREAKARATILEIVGDLPDADVAPPENVLFVCKLNPVTTDDDLEIIFSRFGKVKGCEVIRDKVSGDSLQYAFVEFEDQKSCESAYFKMDNVLIDDRRIHVDFSQSVARVKWRGKGRGVEHSDISGKLDFNNLRDDRQDKSRKYNDDRRNGPDAKRRSRSIGRPNNGNRGNRETSRSRDRARKDDERRHRPDAKRRSRSIDRPNNYNRGNRERSRSRDRTRKDDRIGRRASRSRDRSRGRSPVDQYTDRNRFPRRRYSRDDYRRNERYNSRPENRDSFNIRKQDNNNHNKSSERDRRNTREEKSTKRTSPSSDRKVARRTRSSSEGSASKAKTKRKKADSKKKSKKSRKRLPSSSESSSDTSSSSSSSEDQRKKKKSKNSKKAKKRKSSSTSSSSE